MLIATVIVVGSAGRRYRPVSSGLLFTWAIAALVWGILRSAVGMALPMLMSRLGGFDAVLTAQAAITFADALARIGLGVMFLLGVVRIMRGRDDEAPR